MSSSSYIAYLMVGMAYLWPWNILISATAYFQDRLHTSPFLSTHCTPLIMIVATLSSICTAWYLARHGQVTGRHVILGLLAITLLFTMLAVSCTYASPPPVAYALFVLTVTAISHWGSTMAQSGSFATANWSKNPLHIQAIMVGQAIAGVVPSVSAVLTAWTAGPRDLYSVYFLTTSCIASVALTLWYGCHTTPLEQPQETAPNDRELFDFRDLKVPILAIFLSFAVSLCFPVFAGATLPVSEHVSRAEFVPLAFLVWNVGDLIGRLTCGVPRFVVRSYHVHYAALRAGFIPTLFLFNIKNQGAVIPSDNLYLLTQFLFGFTGGHLSSSVLICAPNFAAPEHATQVGSCMTLALSIGLAAGSLLALVLASLM